LLAGSSERIGEVDQVDLPVPREGLSNIASPASSNATARSG
jgi:hypothetical protein